MGVARVCCFAVAVGLAGCTLIVINMGDGGQQLRTGTALDVGAATEEKKNAEP